MPTWKERNSRAAYGGTYENCQSYPATYKLKNIKGSALFHYKKQQWSPLYMAVKVSGRTLNKWLMHMRFENE